MPGTVTKRLIGKRPVLAPGSLFILSFGCTAALICCLWVTAWADSSPAQAPVAKTNASDGESETDINKKLSNPISSIWALTFEQNTYRQ